MKARKGCWTCAARKLQCDGGQPTCKRCARAQRDCQGYELRLSWPRDNDKRRAIVGTDAPAPSIKYSDPEGPVNRFFINTTWQDVEHYNHFALRMEPPQCIPSPPGRWLQPRPQTNHWKLIRHFYDSAYLAMVSFDVTTPEIRDSLLSLALVQQTIPGQALLSALLAFTSLHRNGLQNQAVQLKILAIQHLSASVKDGPLMSVKAAAQHVAASMFLASFEILLPSESSGEWLWHVWGAMDMVKATQLSNQSSQSEFGYLLDCVYYHEVLSRFAVRHWRHNSLVPEISDPKKSKVLNRKYPPLTRYRPSPPCPNPTFAILSLLSEICGTLLDPMDSESHEPDYLDHLGTLERQLKEITPASTPSTTSKADIGVELFQMATRVYLIRATQSPWESTTSRVDAIGHSALTGTAVTCNSCEHLFPLFILSCEARRDEDRATILGLIDRTEQNSLRRLSQSISWIKNAIRSVWAQQDLHTDGELLMNYVGVVSTVISASNTIPSFV